MKRTFCRSLASLTFLFSISTLVYSQSAATVTTVAGGAYGNPFSIIRGIAVDKQDNLYIADPGANKIFKISSSGQTTLFAGSVAGYKDGAISTALFKMPFDLVAGKDGSIYVAEDDPGCKIRKISPNGTVSTIAGSTYGYQNGKGSAAQFSRLDGIDIDQYGNLFVVQWNNHDIRKVTPDSTVSWVSGEYRLGSYANGTKDKTYFNYLTDIAVDTNTGNLYVTDSYNFCIRKVLPDGTSSTFAGTNTKGNKDGNGAEARFTDPSSLVFDSEGNLYVGDDVKIKKITPQGDVTTMAGSTFGNQNGPLASAQFKSIYRLAINSKNQLFIVDGINYTVKKIDLVTGFNEEILFDKTETVLYPSPVENTLYIKSDLEHSKEIKILNPTGAIVYQGTESSIDVSSFTSGIYYVLFDKGNQTKSYSFLKR